ncbi:Acetyltransferase (GNAT) family protein [Oscillospiraceae bacterium]|nr:Acetyltransferase (GNAT) family protein [Oscillospiraceae bacterium]
MLIRTAVTEDATEIRGLCSSELGYPCDESLVRVRIGWIDPEREAVFVAVIDDKVCGFIHVERYNTLYSESMANILGLAVSSRCRRRGIGRALIDRAEKWAIENGINVMRLNSGCSRTAAHEFYRSLDYGFEKDQIRFIKKLL